MNGWGGRLALARSADALFNTLLREDQEAAKHIFLRLVRPTEGLEVTSNRVRMEALYIAGDARDRVTHVLQKLIDARLLHVSEGDTAADTQVEVAHEALIRNWPQLGDWLESVREAIRQHRRLSETAEHWQALGRDPGALLPSALLNAVTRTVKENELALNALETEFLTASEQHIANEQARELARQVELAKAQASADAERRRALDQTKTAQRLRWLAMGMAILMLLVGLGR